MERTVCACPDCVACCKKQPGPLVPSCAYFDTHMPADEAQRRSIHMATLQTDVGYQRMRATLGPARED